MPVTRNIEYFKRALARKPAMRRPNPDRALRDITTRSREYRGALRSFDAARIELGIATPLEVHRQNSPFASMRPRLTNFHVAAPKN